MAKITVKTPDEFCLKLSKLETGQEEIAGKAIYAGAKIVADQIRANLKAIPEDKFRYLRNGDKLNSISKSAKEGLANQFGVSSMKIDKDGNYNVKCGFMDYLDGEIVPATKGYPNGLPAAMVARSIESGSSVRQKHPFVRPAIAATKEPAKQEMGRVIDEECAKIMKG